MYEFAFKFKGKHYGFHTETLNDAREALIEVVAQSYGVRLEWQTVCEIEPRIKKLENK